MMTKHYPFLSRFELRSGECCCFERRCSFCGKDIPKKEQRLRIEIEVSYMRGEDDVFFTCNSCIPKLQKNRMTLSDAALIDEIYNLTEQENRPDSRQGGLDITPKDKEE
ncbi:MAG: hypothetical protein V3V47_00445 [Desulfobacteria bacterium]